MIEKMEKMLKVALVGYGKMGKHHIKAIEIQPNSELVAIADPLFADDSASHQISGSISLFSDVEEMFDKAKPDVVHIVTPPRNAYRFIPPCHQARLSYLC
ncbi:MAG: hypothetical protein B6D72_04720 [gamma proteobacterium symbiont of Ctena orbiculata]|nr:MAG: hypothetical protein B6D72_04720 [gamma proteobacterium symbiont of Ctena orbiculata]